MGTATCKVDHPSARKRSFNRNFVWLPFLVAPDVYLCACVCVRARAHLCGGGQGEGVGGVSVRVCVLLSSPEVTRACV